MSQLHEALNQQIANATVLCMKLHHFHWFVKGENFFTLHAKFEECYNAFAQYIDDVAERLLAIGGTPISTLKSALDKATIVEASGEMSDSQMVDTIINDFSQIVSEIKQASKMAAEAGDEVTVDLLLTFQSQLEKNIWLLRAFLG